MNYVIKMELLSDTIFGSGYSIPGSTDLEIVYDQIGLPYMRGKTFKGNLREAAEDLSRALGGDYPTVVKDLFGREDAGLTAWERLKFSDCRLSESIETVLRDKVSDGQILAEEIKEALTEVRTFTSVDSDTGSTMDGSLRSMRVIKKGLVFELDLYSGKELSREEKGLLAGSILMLKNIGSMRTRGKGNVCCRLYLGDEDVTDEYCDYIGGGVS